MSDEVRTVIKRVDPDVVAHLATQRTRFRLQRDQARAELDAAKAEIGKLSTQNQDLAGRADSMAAGRKVQELERQLREIEHRKTFDRVAKSRGAQEDALDLLYQASGYTADLPFPDEMAIGALLDDAKLKPGISRLFGEAQPPPNGQPAPPMPPRPGPGSGQGSPNAARIPMSPDDPRHGDVKYVWENFDRIAADSKERIERGEI